MARRVGMLVPTASRRAGGIFSAASALSTELARAEVDLRIFAPDDADVEADLAAWGTVPLSLRATRGPAVFGFRPGLRRDLDAARLDIVHLHGLWTYASVAALGWSAARRPRVISPHGMLDSWALQNSALKKRVVTALFERRNVMGATCLHALCASEREAIRAYGFCGPIATIPNGVFLEEAAAEHPRPDWHRDLPAGARVLLFLGRIHPKKGLAQLLQAMALWDGPDAERWHLAIAGWGQAGTEAALKARVAELGLAQRVRFIGPQFGAQKSAALAAVDAFVLPSFSEGLPMAVLEAWAFSLPVLMTDACNLPEGFAAGAAIRLAPEPERMAEGLRELAALSADELDRVGRRGLDLVKARFSWDQVAREMGQAYEWVLGGGAPPDFVDRA